IRCTRRYAPDPRHVRLDPSWAHEAPPVAVSAAATSNANRNLDPRTLDATLPRKPHLRPTPLGSVRVSRDAWDSSRPARYDAMLLAAHGRNLEVRADSS